MTHCQKVYLCYFIAGFIWGVGTGILIALWGKNKDEKKKTG